jgi:hypothetical protein
MELHLNEKKSDADSAITATADKAKLPGGQDRKKKAAPVGPPRRCGLLLPVLATETFDPTGGIDQLLLARIERMAGGTDFRVDFFFES